jgi:putative oxidoreductase
VQRLFSAFPGGWSAAGLWFLRLTLGIGLIADAIASLRGPESSLLMIPAAIESLTGALIIIGLWTPMTGIVACLLQLTIMLMASRMSELHLLRAAVGVSLAFLGPGAWSLDARLFGRRRVEIKHLGSG